MRKQAASGRGYLELATRLLRRVRLADPMVGLWEAADLHWWWRTPRSSDSVGQTFWMASSDEPVAAVILTDWGASWGCDLIVVPHRAGDLLPAMWDHAVRRIEAMSIRDVEVLVGDDERLLRELIADSGFVPLALAWAVPPAWLLSLGLIGRFAAGIALAFAPVFVANLVFAQRFKDTASSTTAFGVNLLGAMIGGVLEYAALWTGYRWLTVLVALLYLGALLTWRRAGRGVDLVPAG